MGMAFRGICQYVGSLNMIKKRNDRKHLEKLILMDV